MKVKKIVIICAILIIILFGINAYAYSNDDYSIYIPSQYTEIFENNFVDDNGLSISIVINSHAYKGEIYTKDNLNELVKETMSISKEDILNSIKNVNEQLNTSHTEDELENLANSIKIETTSIQEISTFSKNNYKCFHFILKITLDDFSYYANQYCVFSKTEYFILSISGYDINYFSNPEILKTIDSFTINNYQEIEEEESLSEKMFISAISTMIFMGICSIFNYRKKKTDGGSEEKMDNEESEIKSNIVKKICCTNCGKEINDNWKYCKYCGYKVNIEEDK